MSTQDVSNRKALLKEALAAIDAMQEKLDASERSRREPIAIIGLGCRYPGGVDDSDSMWRLLRDGVSADEVVARLTEADDGRDQRQLGVVDRHGTSATYTGIECIDWAGGVTGPGFAAQGNILVSE